MGATFNIYLPAAEVSLPNPAEKVKDVLVSGHGETILVVDDEFCICQIVQKNLEANGYKVLTAQSGKEAISLFEANKDRIPLVLTDLMMPGMDGAAVIRMLKSIDPNLRAIGASGLGLNNDGGYRADSTSTNTDFNAFLNKPFHVDLLLRTLNDVLQGP